MKRAIAFVVSIVLVLPGCASAKESVPLQAGPATVAPQTQSADPAFDRYVRALPVGARVKVVERGGRRYTAALLGVEADLVVLQRATRVPEPPRRVPLDAIASIVRHEANGGVSAGKAVLIGAGVGAAAFLGFLLMAFAFIGD